MMSKSAPSLRKMSLLCYSHFQAYHRLFSFLAAQVSPAHFLTRCRQAHPLYPTPHHTSQLVCYIDDC